MSETPVAVPPVVQDIIKEAEELKEVKAPAKTSKLDQKRQQILMDRLRRKMGQGMSQQQALQAIQKEDYDALPIEKKLQRLENIVAHTFQAIGSDITELRHNDQAIADAFDINYRVIERMLKKLGVTEDEQKAAFNEAKKEFEEERAKKLQEHIEAQKKAEEAAEKARVELEAQQDKKIVKDETSGSDPDARVAEGATVFGEG